ncbi:hypothetical protein [Solemya velesiana gill symbiont]|uniref:Uncharacterized protein n=1 Tax=Solemya velesiana gill symbiont TaxID=1918948 RepID=A0A1T2KTN6_9GAMM|nr:hypothetical protein [Solemya velesiana gill symbiont]OOZ36182.1 hypothetical protein BOW51_08455 [Solemya velesiana gill symbiont]
MAYDKDCTTQVSDRALEMIMRDVMDGLVEVSLESAFSDRICDFAIIGIKSKQEPGNPAEDKPTTAEDAEIIDFTSLKRASS